MGREFLVEGVRFLDYIKYQWENYKVQKENEKSQRVSWIFFLLLLQKQIICLKEVSYLVLQIYCNRTLEIKFVLFSLQYQAKAKQTEEEMIYGSRPVTPAKRRFANGTTPSKTPKQRKVNCNFDISP